MKVYVKTSLYNIHCLLASGSDEIEVNLTPTLKKKLILSPLTRYNQIDYVFQRARVSELVMQVIASKQNFVFKVKDYWVRSATDPRTDARAMVKLVFKVA